MTFCLFLGTLSFTTNQDEFEKTTSPPATPEHALTGVGAVSGFGGMRLVRTGFVAHQQALVRVCV
jgi:hypothetical protein